MWNTPIPFMGVQLSSEASVVFQILFGVAEVTVGIMVLRLNRIVTPLAIVICACLLVSTVVSWQLLPGWIEEYVNARRTYRGMSPRPGEVEFMQAYVPVAMLVVPIAVTGWLILIGRRARGAAADQLE